jgi:small conductance mechanosensitive channel
LRKAIISTVQATILTISVLISLGTIGVDIGPALTAAGILGLAVSLGAQTLIKDVIGGLTILLEDEYRVGDQVKIGTIIGEVEAISLRRTDLRDAEGRLYMVPNGDVRIVANETREWARALVEFSLKVNDDLDKVTIALEKSLARLSANQNIKPFLLGDPEMFGWNDIKDWSVVMRLRAKVVAGKHDEISRFMRQYALEELHAAGLTENIT